jgi:hypothetical protein
MCDSPCVLKRRIAVIACTVNHPARLLGQPCLTPSLPREDLCRLFASEAKGGRVRSNCGPEGYSGYNGTFTQHSQMFSALL